MHIPFVLGLLDEAGRDLLPGALSITGAEVTAPRAAKCGCSISERRSTRSPSAAFPVGQRFLSCGISPRR